MTDLAPVEQDPAQLRAQLVAALKVVEAASLFVTTARKPEHEKWWRSPWAEMAALVWTVDAYNEAVKSS